MKKDRKLMGFFVTPYEMEVITFMAFIEGKDRSKYIRTVLESKISGRKIGLAIDNQAKVLVEHWQLCPADWETYLGGIRAGLSQAISSKFIEQIIAKMERIHNGQDK